MVSWSLYARQAGSGRRGQETSGRRAQSRGWRYYLEVEPIARGYEQRRFQRAA